MKTKYLFFPKTFVSAGNKRSQKIIFGRLSAYLL